MADTATPQETLAFYENVSTSFGPDGDRFHYGTDYPRACYTPIPTPFHGVVVANGWQDGHGWYVSIRLTAIPDWYFTVSHLATQSPIAVGTWLEPLRIIGAVGSTGNSTGCHMHGQMATRPLPWDHSGLTYDPHPMIWAALNGTPWSGIWMNPQTVIPEPLDPAPVEPAPVDPIPVDPPAPDVAAIARELIHRALTAALDAV